MRPIVLVLSELSPSRLTTAVISELRLQKIDFRIVYLKKSFSEEKSLERLELTRLDKLYDCTNKIFIIYSCFLVALFMIRVRPRLVYTSGRIASIIGISTSATFRIRNRIHTRHHGIENTLLKSKWAYNLDKIVNALSTEIIAVSKCTSEILRDEGVPHSKIYVIHNGIDVEECSRIRSQRNQLFKPGDMVNPLLLGVIARLTDWKGVQFTAEAFCILRKKYPQLQIRIIGAKADAFERISKILSTEPYESYEFLSQVPNGIESYQDFSVFIHAPLELNSETFGLVYLESLAAGVPSVFTKSGILNEVEVHNSAIIVNSKSSIAIAEAVEKILDDKESLNQIDLEYLSRNYSLDLMAKRYVALILKLLLA